MKTVGIGNARTTLRKFFKPKLVEHIPGKKRVYKNFLGTRTTYTYKSGPFQTGNNPCNGRQPEILRAYSENNLYGLPKDMYIPNAERYSQAIIRNDIPITDTLFTKVKSYLFGLIKGKQKTIETLNFDKRAVMRGPVSDFPPNITHVTKYHLGSDTFDIVGPIKIIR